MGLRKAEVYHRKERSYTRTSKVKSKSYIKSRPPSKVVKFTMGDAKKYNAGGFPVVVRFVSKEAAQIRDNAIEASRQIIIRHLEKNFGTDYYFNMPLFPHHILREHKMAAVAQSDRTFAGMSHAFGKTISVAAQVSYGSTLFVIAISEKAGVKKIRDIIDMVKPKMGLKGSVVEEQK